MGDPHEVLLSESVEALLEKICIEQCQQPPDNYVRRRLAEVGEEASVNILKEISKTQIKKSLSAFIVYMINKSHQNSPVSYHAESVSLCSTSRLRSSPTSSSFNSSPTNGETSDSPLARRQTHFPSSSVIRGSPLFGDQTRPQFNDQTEAEFRESSSFNQTSCSPVARRQTISHSSTVLQRSSRYSDQTHPLFNHQIDAAFRESSSTNETSHSPLALHQKISHSSSVIQRSPQFGYHTGPLFNHQTEAEFREDSETDETSHIPFSRHQTISHSSNVIERSPQFSDQTGHLFNHRTEAELREISSNNETSHSLARRQTISPSSSVIHGSPQFCDQRGPLFNHRTEAEFRESSGTDETSHTPFAARRQTIFHSSSVIQRSPQFGDQTGPQFNHQAEAELMESSSTHETSHSLFARRQKISSSSSVIQRRPEFDDQTGPLFNHQTEAEFRESLSTDQTSHSPSTGRQQTISPSLSVIQRSPEFSDQTGPLFNHQTKAEFRESPLARRQTISPSSSVIQGSPQYGDQRGPLFNHRIEAEFSEGSGTDETSHIPFAARRQAIFHSSSVIQRSPQFGDQTGPQFNHQAEAEFMESSSTHETSHSPSARRQKIPSSSVIQRRPQFDDQTGLLFNHQTEAEFRESLSTDETSHSPPTGRQTISPSPSVIQRSPQFSDQTGPLFNHQTKAEFRETPLARRQTISPSSSVIHGSPQFGDQRGPLFNHRTEAEFRESSGTDETSHIPFAARRQTIFHSSSVIQRSPQFGDQTGPQFNHQAEAEFMESSSTHETSHSPSARRHKISPSSSVIQRRPQFDDQTGPLFNHQTEAEFRESLSADETSHSSSTGRQTISPSPSVIQTSPQFSDQTCPLFNHQTKAEFRESPLARRQTLSPSSGVIQRSSQFGGQASPLFNHQSEAEFKESSSTNETEFVNGASPVGVSSHLLALNQLEFRKFFLLLSYIGKKKLEEVMTPADVDKILRCKGLPMAMFESHIWSEYGQYLCKESDRLQCVDWDSGKTHLYYCYINPDGSRIFKGPYLNAAGTHLQSELGDENVLIVKFLQEGTYCPESIVQEGILVGPRRFRFFVFKDGGKEAKRTKSMVEKRETFAKCYFVRMESLGPCNERDSYILSRKTVHEARCLFMHVHMVANMAKYMARFSLILSKTVKLQIDLASVHVQRIEDIPCLDKNGSVVCDEDKQPLILTDGTGYISEDLAAKCPKNFYKEKHSKDVNYEKYISSLNAGMRSIEIGGIGTQNLEPPLLMQCRLFHNGRAVKGTLLVNRTLPRSSIQIRPSMIKVETDSRLSSVQTFNSLEIVAISHKPKRTLLSKNLIALLSYGGVPREFFLDLLMSALEEAHNIYTNERTALKVAENYAERDDVSIARNMLWADIPLNEPFLHYCLSTMAKEERNGLKEGKLPIGESFYLMGTVDPTGTVDRTGTLNSDEVCIILDNGQISGKVLVYRNPGLHFGDIHILTAVYVRALEDIVGNAKYAIFFSTKGQRSVASEIANGDFDGDRYWISRNPQLIEYFRGSKPWERIYSTPKASHRKPTEFSAEELEHELFRQFLEAKNPCYAMATAADSWLALMDQLLTLGNDNAEEKETVKSKMLQLIDIYYDALDAPKSGNKVNVPGKLKVALYPHYMGKGDSKSYHSNSVLGEIYDNVISLSQNQKQPAPEIWKLPCFDAEIPEDCLSLWRVRYSEYRGEMTEVLNSNNELKNDSANDVVKKYKELLYGSAEFHKSTRNTEDIYNEALAIYHLAYGYAMSKGDVKKCGFAWKVAGPALCKIFIMKQGETPLICSPSAVRKIL